MVTKAQLDAQNAIIEELKGLIVKLQEKVADLEQKKMSYEQSKKSNISEEKTWAISLGLGTDFANQIEQVRNFYHKTHQKEFYFKDFGFFNFKFRIIIKFWIITKTPSIAL